MGHSARKDLAGAFIKVCRTGQDIAIFGAYVLEGLGHTDPFNPGLEWQKRCNEYNQLMSEIKRIVDLKERMSEPGPHPFERGHAPPHFPLLK